MHFKWPCPKDSKTDVKDVLTFKILGPIPLQSQVIQNRDTKKNCFLGRFLEKILIFTHFDQTAPPPSLPEKLWISAFQAKSKFFFNEQAVRILVTLLERLYLTTSQFWSVKYLKCEYFKQKNM